MAASTALLMVYCKQSEQNRQQLSPGKIVQSRSLLTPAPMVAQLITWK